MFSVPGETRMRFCLLELTLESGFDPELSGFSAPLLPTLLAWTGLGTVAKETFLKSDQVYFS